MGSVGRHRKKRTTRAEKRPLEIRILDDIVKVKLKKNLYRGYFSPDDKLIEYDGDPETLLHEIMEYTASSFFGVKFHDKKKKDREIVFSHAPEFNRDTWTVFVKVLRDTIVRNDLKETLFG
jgi:hypothetical protein